MHVKKSLELLDAKIDKTLHEIAAAGELPTHGQLERLYIEMECREHIKEWKAERESEAAASKSAPTPTSPLATRTPLA